MMLCTREQRRGTVETLCDLFYRSVWEDRSACLADFCATTRLASVLLHTLGFLVPYKDASKIEDDFGAPRASFNRTAIAASAVQECAFH